MSARRSVASVVWGLVAAGCGGDAAGPDAGVEPVERGAEVAFATDGCALSPAELDGASVWVDERGLWLAPHEAAASSAPRLVRSWAAGEGAHDPVITREGPTILVAVDRAAGAELRAYDREGTPLWAAAVDEPRALAPMVAPGRIVWPILTADGARYSWRDGQTGREVLTLVSERAPSAPLVATGERLEGGGTHWVVGTQDGVELLFDPLTSSRLQDLPPIPPRPRIAARWSSERPVLRLSGVGQDVAAVLGPVADERLQLLRVGPEGTLVAAGAPIALPGEVHADPVVFACDASNVDRWFCAQGASGAVVLAGDGWLGAWSLPEGRELARRALSFDVSVVTLGASGEVAGGGTHWLPSGALGWRLALLDPSARADDLELAEGEGGCTTSPLWDSDGTITTVVVGPEPLLVRSVARGGLLGIAPGRPRGRGGRHNAVEQVASALVCDDRVTRGVGAVALGGDFIEGVALSGTAVVAYGARDGRGLLRWLPGDAPAAEQVVDDTADVERAVGLGDGSVAVAYRDAGARLHVRAFSPAGSAWDWSVDGEGVPLALVRAASGELWLGVRGGSSDAVHRVDPVAGPVETRAFFEDEGIGLAQLAVDPRGGALMVLDGSPRIGVRWLDALAQPGPLIWWGDGEAVRVAVSAGVDGEGLARVVVDRVGGGPELWIFEGDAREVVPLPVAAELAAFGPDGDALAIAPEGLVRVSKTGRLGLMRAIALGPDLEPLGRALVADASAFVAAFTRRGPELVWMWADGHGFTSCGDVGACGGRPDACDAEAPCEPRGCAPDTGACVVGELGACGL